MNNNGAKAKRDTMLGIGKGEGKGKQKKELIATAVKGKLLFSQGQAVIVFPKGSPCFGSLILSGRLSCSSQQEELSTQGEPGCTSTPDGDTAFPRAPLLPILPG